MRVAVRITHSEVVDHVNSFSKLCVPIHSVELW